MNSNDNTLAPSKAGRMRSALARLQRDQQGASFVEYVIVVGLVAIVCIMAFGDFGEAIEDKVNDQTQAIQNMQ